MRSALFVLEQITGTSDAVPYAVAGPGAAANPGGLIAHVCEVGPRFERRLEQLREKHRVVAGVRGAGVMRGLELTVDAQRVVDGAREAGLIVNRTAERVVRMLPPFTVTEAEIDEGVGILDAVLTEVSG
jgi:4-aminobutyrate aminotransferase-like enzyme